jgi:hypothetical protein
MSIDSVATHPVPSRLSDGPEVPFIGPNFEAYKKAHAETVGPNADKWWAKVCRTQEKSGLYFVSDVHSRWQEKHFIGIFRSGPLDQEALRTAISHGSQRVT